MNSLLHREGDDDLDEMNGPKDREITLGTTLILGIFFALAILCAVFFGFGYSVGRRTAVVSAPASAPGQSTNTFGGFKPSPGSPLSSQTTAAGPTVTVPFVSNSTPPPAQSAPKTPAAAPAEENEPAAEAPTAEAPPPSHPAPVVQAPPSPAALPAVTPGGNAIVQIAAVSHQEDAELLVTTLKRRGYNVSIKNESQDKLLHVQVGPFASHKDADAMRQRLLADGFNAIVKDAH